MVTLKLPPGESADPRRAMPLLAWALPLILPLFLTLLFTLAIASITQPRAAGAKASAPADKPASHPPTAAPVSEGVGPLILPAFTLPDLEGKHVSSQDWQGKLVLVDFWATWCVGCRQTIPALSRLQEKYGSQGLVVVGISVDKGAGSKVAKFARKLKVNYTVLLDAEDTLSKVFGFEGLPSLYLFDRKGKLVKSMPGYSVARDKELEALVAGRFPAQ